MFKVLETLKGLRVMFDSPKDPSTVPGYLLVAVAFWGGLVSFLTRTKFRGVPLRTHLLNLAKDIVICTFAAFLLHCLCMLTGITGWANAFAVGVGSHMGTKAIGLAEEILRGRLKFSIKGMSDDAVETSDQD